MENNKELSDLCLSDGTYKTTLTKKFNERKAYVPENPKELLSVIPGEVVQLEVVAGQTVKAGDELLVYKAMKMHNRILSPMDGTIKAVHVQEGSNLPKGALMVEFE